MTIRALVLLVGMMGSGLIGGLFFGWTVSVIPGMARISDKAYVSTMQHINRAILNPGFIIAFLGVPAVLVLGTYLHWRVGEQRRARLLAAATLVYLLGVLGITFGGNVALNNALDAFDLGSTTPDRLAHRRQSYEGPWNRWHNLRSMAAVLAFGLASAAALATEE